MEQGRPTVNVGGTPYPVVRSWSVYKGVRGLSSSLHFSLPRDCICNGATASKSCCHAFPTIETVSPNYEPKKTPPLVHFLRDSTSTTNFHHHSCCCHQHHQHRPSLQFSSGRLEHPLWSDFPFLPHDSSYSRVLVSLKLLADTIGFLTQRHLKLSPGFCDRCLDFRESGPS